MEEEDEEEILALVEDEHARDILTTLTTEPMSVSELCSECGISDPTAYRRLDRLQEVDLVTENQEIDPDGHHYKKYVSTVGEVTVTFENGRYDVAVAQSTDPSDRFTDLFEGLS